MTQQITKLLFVIPAKVFESGYFHLGSTKDIFSRLEYLESRKIPFDFLKHEPTEQSVLECLEAIALDQYSHILIEKGNYPSALKYIKKHAPNTQLIYRSHNAEILHRWDYLKCQLKSNFKIKSHLKSISKFSQREYLTAKHADTILAISDWEQKNYWKYFKKKEAIKYTPFYMADRYLRNKTTQLVKENLCICFSSSHPGPIILDSIINFLDLVDQADPIKIKNWKFIITGDNPGPNIGKKIKESNHNIAQKNFETPYQALEKARAVLILSDYGRGFKTKILEAILYECYVFVTKGLYERIPENLKMYCYCIEINNPEAFIKNLNDTQKEFPKIDINEKLKEQAFHSLDEVFYQQTK